MRSAAARSFVMTWLVVLARPVLGGDLNPPAGPIGPSMKALDIVEPRTPLNQDTAPGDASAFFRITQPGSYYLTGPVTLAADQGGIEITTDNVTIDLSGFTIFGPGGGTVGDGIRCAFTADAITVRNGNIQRCQQGVALFATTNCRLSDVRVSDCSANGVLTGANAVLERCSALNCGLTGLAPSTASVISHCTVRQCGTAGIYIGDGACVIVNSTVFLSAGPGIIGGSGCSIIDCVVTANGTDGIQAANNCLIRGCTASANGFGGSGAGIHLLATDSRVEGNLCTGNPRGIDIDQGGNIVVRNTCSGNTTNWDVAAGNAILVVNAATSGAFTGNSGGAPLGSTDPNANFTY